MREKKKAEPLSEEQQAELAACYLEYQGIPETSKTDVYLADKFVCELMKIWKRRTKKQQTKETARESRCRQSR